VTRGLRIVAILACALATPACAAYGLLSVGDTHGLRRGNHGHRATVEIEEGGTLSAGGDRSPAGGAMGLVVQGGNGIFQLAPTMTVRVIPGVERVMPFFGVGMKPLFFEWNHDHVSVGGFSPLVDAGALFLVYGPDSRKVTGDLTSHEAFGGWSIAVRGMLGYDVRFGATPNEVFGAVTIGLAMMMGAQ